jgi:hypothetical protein
MATSDATLAWTKSKSSSCPGWSLPAEIHDGAADPGHAWTGKGSLSKPHVTGNLLILAPLPKGHRSMVAGEVKRRSLQVHGEAMI